MLHMLTIARVAAGAYATSQGIDHTRVHRQSVVVVCKHCAGALGHLPRVAEQSKTGDIGNRVHCSALSLQCLGGQTVESTHARNGLGLVGIAASCQCNCCAQRLRDHQDVANQRALFTEDAIGVHQALHRESEDGLRVADGVPAGNSATCFGNHCGRSVEDGNDGFAWEVLGECSHVDGNRDAPTHCEHVATRVGRGDGAKVRRVVDKRRKEVGGANHREVVADLVHRSVVERGKSHNERRI